MKRKLRQNIIWVSIITVGAILLIVSAYYSLYAPTYAWFKDPENDIELNIGTEYPGMIDVINASLETNENELKITINTRDSISDLDKGERAQWNVTIILDEYAYEIWVEKNSTHLEGYVTEVGKWNASACQVEFHKNSLTIITFMDKLQSTKEIEWLILTMFERVSEDETMVNGYDIAPDDGFITTIIEE